jgi:membrane fusion protein, peptide pheromone/bacteriocin exporter
MLFPPEIINNSVELHHIRNKVKTKIIYIAIVVAVFIFFASLPFIYVDITTQARGILKSTIEKYFEINPKI